MDKFLKSNQDQMVPLFNTVKEFFGQNPNCARCAGDELLRSIGKLAESISKLRDEESQIIIRNDRICEYKELVKAGQIIDFMEDQIGQIEIENCEDNKELRQRALKIPSQINEQKMEIEAKLESNYLAGCPMVIEQAKKIHRDAS